MAQLLSYAQISLRRRVATEDPFRCPTMFDVAVEDTFADLAKGFIRSGCE